ncbi:MULTISPECIES: CDP-glycerol glycerophosphotransferase family protein [unclassified Mesobacillus]|uniref:CDP-glycerol glycerophosphotransferase family protein n=1 Tax=unclassified Mesobacillus TaxID=2675270 RepID=UPI00203E7114|nr:MULTISPECIES: CDP-glycerol glycerophosphotransferase family protein [unclassified Mesobacillus]MCM3124152.1 CDP-glycerol glycerophosphotransferase family protein [Mesobacillus sp. MER 33]MCM3234001.1 CDP-glycerol glycerophosphotransferase family protein [Mesobacillus sp. MER 48]
MISRIKRKVKRVVFRKDPVVTSNTYESELGTDLPVMVDEERIIIRKENLGESLPIINEMAGLEEKLIPRRKVTYLKWNGPIMTVRGYFYLENFPMKDEDLVKKRLVLLSNTGIRIIIPLRDIPVEYLNIEDKIDEKYRWAGFEGKINFATIDEKNRPLPAAEYKVYIETEVHVLGDQRYKKIFPLGNVQSFLDKGFHSSKMEYFTATREMKFNLLATYDLPVKTLKITSSKLKDFDPREMSLDAEENKAGLFHRFFQTAGFRLLYKWYSLRPIKEKKVLFASDSRSDMSGNFQFVYEEMLKRNLDLDYRFMLKSGVGEKKTFKEIKKLAYHLATSKFIILDDFYPMVYPLTIREGAELIQLWHAVGAFKTFGFSRIGRPGGPSPRSRNHRNYTKAIVSSKHVAKYYAEGFGIEEDKVIPTGVPRTDIFFDENYKKEVQARLYEEFPFLRGKKVITFAPTFRGNGQQSAHYPMEVLNLEKLYKELKDDYVFLFKIHPFVKNDFNIPYQYKDFFYDFSEYREINDLLFVTDLLITDYSSVCFEYALLNKPMIFFAYDVEEYVQTRDFYFEYTSFIPGPLARSTDDIIKTIKDKDFKMDKIKPFIEYFFDQHDGKSSARVVDQIILGELEEENSLK